MSQGPVGWIRVVRGNFIEVINWRTVRRHNKEEKEGKKRCSKAK